MKKIISFILLAMPLLFIACDENDDYHGGPGWIHGGGSGGQTTQLNSNEKKLVGSYVSDDDPSSVFYLVLNENRSGSFKVVKSGQTTGDEFTWSATSNKITVVYKSDNQKAVMDYYYANNHLYVDDIPLVVNEGGDPGVSDNPLIGQWQGSIIGYYSAMWQLKDGDYETVCEFASNGEGAQVDYDIFSPKKNYAYNPFTWTMKDNVITIKYVSGSELPMATISDHALTSSRFTGTVVYDPTSSSTSKSFNFKYDKVTGFDWSIYTSDSGAKAAKSRLKMLRQSNSKAIACGVFATAK